MNMNMRRRQPPPSCLQSLPDEVILEIFLRVPVRSVIRLKCVCKSWKILISSPQFAKDHFRMKSFISSVTSMRLASLAYYNHRKLITTCPVQSLLENPLARRETSSFTVENRWVEILGSSNGLLCLADNFCLFRLINPFTRSASKKSPPLPLRLNVFKDEVAQYGFGYDQLNDKYKVLVTYGFPRVTKLYTFGTQSSWTTIQNFPCDQVPQMWYKAGKFVSGTLNWFVLERNVIISFDLEKETYGEVLLPLHLESDHPNQHRGHNPNQQIDIDALSNCLCLCYFNDIHYVVWVMKKYGNQQSWTKLVLIPHSNLKMHRLMCIDASYRFAYLHPLWISENAIAFKRTTDLQLVIYKNGKMEDDREIMERDTHSDLHIYRMVLHYCGVLLFCHC
ncbi:F-box/kelch-repeat protein At3g23880-like [Lotus japonicus]|uniref:F-box/kelch-repeat protein At3g23880-like n=1 Tax=Lotus japonicus TaxID=34305 RepID=UPI00258A1A63|nr:F-box/kelch-repeat protein At3g23880-like [Lotus japonicus]